MSSKPSSMLQKVLIWSYDRGTIPYDVICVLILAFIFLTPRSCFERKAAVSPGREVGDRQALAPAGR